MHLNFVQRWKIESLVLILSYNEQMVKLRQVKRQFALSIKVLLNTSIMCL